MLDKKIDSIKEHVLDIDGVSNTRYISFIGLRLLVSDKINKIEQEILRIDINTSSDAITTNYIGYIKARKELKDILKTIDKLE